MGTGVPNGMSSSHSNPDKQDEPSLPEDGFGERIDELVAEIGVGELAEKSGISRRMLAKYRAGAEVNRRNLLALASAAHVRLEWLASGQEPKRSGTMVVKETGPGYDASGYVALPHYDVAASACARAWSPASLARSRRRTSLIGSTSSGNGCTRCWV